MDNVKQYGYMRVSTKDQNEDRQRIALVDAGVSEDNIFMDKQTGKDFNRPEYKKLLDVLDDNSVLFIKSIDRLGRNYSELNEQWRIITKEKQADICVLDMPILDTRQEKGLVGTLISDLVLTLLSYVAENERINIRQRQAEGIAAAKARGVRFGRPKAEAPDNLTDMIGQWERGRIKASDIAREWGVSERTFYRRLRAYREVTEDNKGKMRQHTA